MKAEYINPFSLASFSVLEAVLGDRPVRGAVALQRDAFTSHQCNVVCGVTGQVQGQVIFGMSMATADAIASAMLGAKIAEFDQLAASAIGELANMICGNALQHLSEGGLVCDITPPSIIRGHDVSISTLTIPTVVIPLTTRQGQVCITIGLQGRK